MIEKTVIGTYTACQCINRQQRCTYMLISSYKTDNKELKNSYRNDVGYNQKQGLPIADRIVQKIRNHKANSRPERATKTPKQIFQVFSIHNYLYWLDTEYIHIRTVSFGVNTSRC